MRGDDPIRETTSTPETEPSTRLGRLWEATRPDAPSARDWDRVWSAVSAELDRPAEADHPAIIPAPRRAWAAVGLIVMAQAAAVLLALGLTWGHFDADPSAIASPTLATQAVRVEEGQLVLIRSDADVVQITDLSVDGGSDGVDAWYLVYNLLESLANPVVAMSE